MQGVGKNKEFFLGNRATRFPLFPFCFFLICSSSAFILSFYSSFPHPLLPRTLVPSPSQPCFFTLSFHAHLPPKYHHALHVHHTRHTHHSHQTHHTNHTHHARQPFLIAGFSAKTCDCGVTTLQQARFGRQLSIRSMFYEFDHTSIRQLYIERKDIVA